MESCPENLGDLVRKLVARMSVVASEEAGSRATLTSLLREETRKAIVAALHLCPGLTASALARVLGMTPSGVVKHLRQMEAAGVVERVKTLSRLEKRYVLRVPVVDKEYLRELAEKVSSKLPEELVRWVAEVAKEVSKRLDTDNSTAVYMVLTALFMSIVERVNELGLRVRIPGEKGWTGFILIDSSSSSGEG